MAESKDIHEIKFFGAVTASCSHELKNVLAIVNENAGLIEDMLTFAAKGREVNPARIIAAALAINTQVRRGEIIIRNLNRFAHSSDEISAVILLDQAVELALGLAMRMIAMRGFTVTVSPTEQSIKVKTSPFAFQQLMWRCLDIITALEASTGESVNIKVEPAAGGACIRFKRSSGRSPVPLTDQSDTDLLSSVGAEAEVNSGTGEMIIRLNEAK